MKFNYLAILVAALVPIIIGFVWYNPKVFGTIWMKESGLSEEDLNKGNMPLIFIVSIILSLLLAFDMNFVVVHQYHIYSALMDMGDVAAIEDPSTPLGALYAEIMENYGMNFRTFKHGVLHGVLASVFFMLPILGINALFERKSFKYIALNASYWLVSLAIMGGIISAWV